jgi:hypothetical protein
MRCQHELAPRILDDERCAAALRAHAPGVLSRGMGVCDGGTDLAVGVKACPEVIALSAY